MTASGFARCWNESFPDRFHIEPQAAWNQAYGSEWYRREWSGETSGQGGETAALIVGKQGSQEDTAHIAALAGQPRLCKILLRESIERMRSSGVRTLRFGTDLDHFWPGVPHGVPWLSGVLQQAGFVLGGELWDMGRDLLGYRPVRQATELGAQVARCRANDLAPLQRFLEREFPGRWRTDTSRKAAEDPGDVFLLWVKGRIHGFAVTQTALSQRPHAGAVFRAHLGEDWCTLGPIGISAEQRGKGLGDALLSEALAGLRDSGGRGCTIDWTVLTEFYGRHGFLPTATYRAAEMDLAPVS